MQQYKYLGKEVEVVRLTSNNTAQLADGSWVPVGMLHPVKDEPTGMLPSALTTALEKTKKSAKQKPEE